MLTLLLPISQEALLFHLGSGLLSVALLWQLSMVCRVCNQFYDSVAKRFLLIALTGLSVIRLIDLIIWMTYTASAEEASILARLSGLTIPIVTTAMTDILLYAVSPPLNAGTHAKTTKE